MARYALGAASLFGLALCATALVTGLVIVVVTVEVHQWLEKEGPV